MRLTHVPLAIVLLALLVFADGVLASADAQQQEVLLSGRVIEEQTETPIVGVLVDLRDVNGRRLARRFTNEAGEFEFSVGHRSGYRIFASRIGYRDTLTPVLWTDANRFFRLEVRLDPEAVLLAPLEVVARARVRPGDALEGFRHRQHNGMGHYFTRADIERINPARVTDLLRQVPGVSLIPGSGGRQRNVQMARSQGLTAARSCPVQLFVDGFLLNRPIAGGGDAPFTIDEAVSPMVVEGIEVYRSHSTVPAEFMNANARCGVVAIWTRRGP